MGTFRFKRSFACSSDDHMLRSSRRLGFFFHRSVRSQSFSLAREHTIRVSHSPSKLCSSSCILAWLHDHVRRSRMRHVRRQAWRWFVRGCNCNTKCVYERVNQTHPVRSGEKVLATLFSQRRGRQGRGPYGPSQPRFVGG